MLQHYQRRVTDGALRADESQRAAAEQLHELHQALRAEQPKPGLVARFFGRQWVQHRGIYLWGGVGTGKTLLMDIFHRALPKKISTRIHFHRFMQAVHDEKKIISNKQDPLAEIAARLASRCRVLCLDEFAVTDITDAMILSNLLHHLFENDVALVTTSNSPPDELYKNGLQRARFLPAIELLKTQTRVINVDNGHDYRADYLKETALYHVPHNAEAITALTKSFTELEGGVVDENAIKPGTVTLCGREVKTIAKGRETIWFNFDSLCNGNRSKLDYIELATRFYTIIISDIPPLDATKDDATRRFIELIDELYDRQTNLLASATTTPNKLYTGKRLREAFQRTISRLIEMSADDYLERAKR